MNLVFIKVYVPFVLLFLTLPIFSFCQGYEQTYLQSVKFENRYDSVLYNVIDGDTIKSENPYFYHERGDWYLTKLTHYNFPYCAIYYPMEYFQEDCERIGLSIIAQKIEEDFTKAISLNPKYGYSYEARAMAKIRTGKWDEAIEDYKIAYALLGKNLILEKIKNLEEQINLKDLYDQECTLSREEFIELRTGKFKWYGTPIDTGYFTTDFTSQIEHYYNDSIVSNSSVEWLDNCEYKLTLIKSTNHEWEWDKGKPLLWKIIKLDDNLMEMMLKTELGIYRSWKIEKIDDFNSK